MATGTSSPIPAGARLATAVGRAVGGTSRRLGLGTGSVIGGRVTLALDPAALRRAAAGHRVALVSGTNGKTTTNRFLAAALATAGPVATNGAGANLPAGLVAALGGAPAGAPAALEVDEAWMGHVAEAVDPAVVALLNLSRDQLDRVSEVRRLGSRWRAAVEGRPGLHVVANADDPIVAWAASAASRVTWVAAGQGWRLDSSGCPACEGRITFEGEAWSCGSCGLARPAPGAWLDGDELVAADGRRWSFGLSVPGRFNRANAAMAAMAAEPLGVDVGTGLAAMGRVFEVEGRYQVVSLGAGGSAVRARLLLAKNPAGWVELLGLLDPAPDPVVLAINARVADGRDPSWLWDVPFELLAGRVALAVGERRFDLAVRLRYAEVEHLVEDDPVAALRRAAGLPRRCGRPVDVVANYTAFQDLRAALAREGAT